MTTSIDGFDGAQGIKPVVVTVRDSNTQSSTSTSATDAAVKPEPPADAERVADATRKVEELFQTVRRNLNFRQDPGTGRTIVSVIDADSGELVRQIPAEQMIRMAEHLEYVNGLLLGERA